MTLKRENVGDHKILYLRTTADEEFDAFEQLGPAMRQALRDAPIKSSSVAILKQITDKNSEIEKKNDERKEGEPELRTLDPLDPHLDLYLAQRFLMLNEQNLRLDRSDEDAQLGVTPIHSNITVKSIREQRRSATGARRWR